MTALERRELEERKIKIEKEIDNLNDGLQKFQDKCNLLKQQKELELQKRVAELAEINAKRHEWHSEMSSEQHKWDNGTKRKTDKVLELISFLNGVMPIVELWQAETPLQVEWKRDWLERVKISLKDSL